MHNSEIEIIVRSTEIDVNGHVNNAKYLEYLEWGREDWYEQRSLFYDVLKKAGITTVVVHVSADYKHEAIQNDKLRIRSWLKTVGNTSFVMEQIILNQHDEIVVRADFVIVTVNPATHEKVRVPDFIRTHVEDTTSQN